MSLLPHLCFGGHDPLIIFDTQGVIVSINPRAADLFDYDASMLRGQSINTIITLLRTHTNGHNGNGNGHAEEFNFTSDESYLTQMHTGKRRDDSHFPVEVMITRFEANNKLYALAIIRDLQKHVDYHVNDEVLQKLSPRQMQILRLVAEGYTSREIADMLTISVKTVETHRANIMSKLKVRNVTGLVRFAMAHNLI